MNVVTGGLGFIGNELVRQLLRANEELVVLDNRNRVAPDIGDLAHARVVEVDLTSQERSLARRVEGSRHKAQWVITPRQFRGTCERTRLPLLHRRDLKEAAPAPFLGTSHLGRQAMN